MKRGSKHGDEHRRLTIPALLEQSAAAAPDAPALRAPGSEPLSYGQLCAQTARIAGQLRTLGMRPSDRVVVVCSNGPELASAFLGVASACVCAPLNHAYRPAEFDFYLSDLDARAVLVAAGVDSPVRTLADRKGTPVVEIERLESAHAGAITLSKGKARSPMLPTVNDTALMLHTSGTTSRPKLVPLTHGQLVLSARNIARTLQLNSDDSCLNVMPLFHIHALVGTLLSSMTAGASVICAPGFRAPSFHGWLDELKPTWYSAVPTMHQSVLERVPDLAAARRSSLRFIRSSSAPLPTHVHEGLEETFGVPVIEAYGMTEAAHQMTSNPLPPGVRKPGSVGFAEHIDVAILDPKGRMLGRGETGEVAIRGDTVFAGYEANPEANDEAFVGEWFRTGDEGWIDDDGYLVLSGRSKEIINRAGEKVSPGEVENVLLGHPDVKQAVSFAVPHGRLGEDVGAAVVLRDGANTTERELQQHAAANLAHFKVPSVVAVVDEVPLGPTGKLQRIGLAERLGIGEIAQSASTAPYVAPRTPFEREMAELWAAVLDVERVGVDDDFFALGGDSILGAELIARLIEREGRELPLTTLMWAPTLGAFAALIEEGSWDTDSRIVPVQPAGSKPPLFVTHALYDEIVNIAVLKRTLGDEQPLYAVRAVVEGFDYGSVEEMAADYFREIQEIQPSGPYLFASICSGVAIVVELARRAHAEGEDVALAAVIDPRADLGWGFVRHYVRRTVKHVQQRRFRWAVDRKIKHWLARLMPERFADPNLEDSRLGSTLSSVRRRFRYRHVPGTLTVIATMDYRTPRTHWDDLADRVDWYEVAAPHRTIFQQPNADILGAVMARVIEEASGGGGT